MSSHSRTHTMGASTRASTARRLSTLRRPTGCATAAWPASATAPSASPRCSVMSGCSSRCARSYKLLSFSLPCLIATGVIVQKTLLLLQVLAALPRVAPLQGTLASHVLGLACHPVWAAILCDLEPLISFCTLADFPWRNPFPRNAGVCWSSGWAASCPAARLLA